MLQMIQLSALLKPLVPFHIAQLNRNKPNRIAAPFGSVQLGAVDDLALQQVDIRNVVRGGR